MAKLPQTFREPPLTMVSRYKNAETVRSILDRLSMGEFREPSLMFEDMLRNPRLRAVNETRMNGFVGTPIRWEPGRQNAKGRQAAKAIEEDWSLIVTEATRKQLHELGIGLGVSLAQKHWYVSESSGRLIPRVQVYHSQWAYWFPTTEIYKVQTFGDGLIDVPSPSYAHQRVAGLGTWVVHEPFGKASWRRGLIHAAAEPVLGHNWAGRDQSRASEKLGIGIVKAKYVEGRNKEDVDRFVNGTRRMNAEAVVPCAIPSDGGPGFDLEPLEWTGAGYEMIHRTKDSKAVDIAILYLGHNLTTEAKGGSYAAANIGDLIRGDIKAFDAKSEATTIREQVLADWAEANFGDPELAPIAVYETDPPALNLTAAQTLAALGQAAQLFAKFPNVDLGTLFARFRLPQLAGVDAKIIEPAKPPAPPVQQPTKEAP